MGYKWPNAITLQFKLAGRKCAGLLVIVRLHADRKNDFSIGPIFVNEDGSFLLDKDNLDKIIEEKKHEYPMDYEGYLEDCNSIEIIVDNREQLLERVQRLEAFYPEIAKNLKKDVEISTNYNVSPYREQWALPLANAQISIDLNPSNLNK